MVCGSSKASVHRNIDGISVVLKFHGGWGGEIREVGKNNLKSSSEEPRMKNRLRNTDLNYAFIIVLKVDRELTSLTNTEFGGGLELEKKHQA